MLLRLALVLALALGARSASAFHDGGAGACEGCHSMHGKPDAIGQSARSLLSATDPSSTCLSCHASQVQGTYQVLTTPLPTGAPPQQYTPGGDFAWLSKSFGWMADGVVQSSPGEHHGHSISAADFGLSPDVTRTTAPGGSYPSDQLTCISCHDPHGRYRLGVDGMVSTTGRPIVASGSYGGADLRQPTPEGAVGTYRMLGGSGYAPKSAGSVVPFFSGPPVALAPAAYNLGERTSDVRVAYGTGMSEWCGNCHGAIHTAMQSNTDSTFLHPTGQNARLNTGGELAIYNNYIRTGVLTGDQLTSYTSLVPYEEGISDRASLAQRAVNDGSVKNGPSTGLENVSCITCHRAHATAWDHALRWNMPSSGIIVFGGAWPGVDSVGEAAQPRNAQGRTQAETRAAMYDRDASTYAAYQKVLCNKCHAKD